MPGAHKSRVSKGKQGGKKKRAVKRTILFYGEGKAEEAFLHHLFQLYGERGTGKSIQRKGGSGGGQIAIVANALAYKAGQAEYDEIHILLDEDNKEMEREELIRLAKQRIRQPGRRRINPAIYFSSPVCLEGLFLAILGQAVNPATTDAQQCKVRMNQQGLPEPEKFNASNYQAIFPKQLMDEARRSIALLNEIITIFE